MSTKKKLIGSILVIFFISLMIEVFVFNVRFFQSALYDEKTFGNEYVMSLEGGHLLENGDIELDEGYDFFRLTIGNIDDGIKNVRFDVEIVDEPVSRECKDHVCDVEVAVWDDALHEKMGEDGLTYCESGFYDLTGKKVLHNIDSSQYIWLQTYGNTKALQFDISSESGMGKVFRVNDITFNATERLSIHAVRLFAVFLVMFTVYFALFWGKNWEIDCVTPALWKRVVPIVLLVIVAITSFFWLSLNPTVINTSLNEYDNLARALFKDKVSAGEESELVNSMDIPYRVLTGASLPNFIPVVILCLVVMAEIYLLLGMLISRFYRNMPYFVRILMTGAAVAGMYIPLFISAPDHYVIPFLSGLILILAGIMFWLKGGLFCHCGAAENGHCYKTGYIAAGSICMASVFLCRPTMLLVGLLLFVVCVVTDRKGILAQSMRVVIKNGLAVFIPYFIFASVCMYYNYICFDYNLDFGASKNMTTIPFNVGNGFLPYQILRSVYEYLWAPAVFTTEFPFFTYQSWEQITEGSSLIAVAKPNIGLFTGTPVLWMGVLCIMYRKSLKEKHLWYLLVTLFVCALLLMSFTTRFSFFITERYSLEFSFIFYLVAFVGIMELLTDLPEKIGEKLLKVCRFVVVSLLLAAVFFGFLQLFPEQKSIDLSKGNTELFYRIYYAMNFML